jgi:hypothetical protein
MREPLASVDYVLPDEGIANYFDKHSLLYPYSSALSPNSSEVPDIAIIVGSGDGIYNRIGRGIPDVSANGDNDAVCVPFPPCINRQLANEWFAGLL